MALDARTIIERNTLFRGLSARTLDQIVALAGRRTYREDTVIFTRGDPGDSLYGVVTGRVRISVSAPGGKEVYLNVMQPGDSFGEISLLDGEPRSASARTITATELMFIPRAAFIALLKKEPPLALHLIHLLCERVRWAHELMEDSTLLTAPERLAKRLLSLAGQQGRASPVGVKVSLSQEELATYLGLSRQIVNQHLQEWRGKGWVSLGRGSVTIADERALRKLTG